MQGHLVQRHLHRTLQRRCQSRSIRSETAYYLYLNRYLFKYKLITSLQQVCIADMNRAQATLRGESSRVQDAARCPTVRPWGRDGRMRVHVHLLLQEHPGWHRCH